MSRGSRVCGMDLPVMTADSQSEPDYQQHNHDRGHHNQRMALDYHDLTCTEALPRLDILPHSSSSFSMDTILTSGPILPPHPPPSPSSVPMPSSASIPRPLLPQSSSYGKPTLHVEVCQNAESSMRSSRLKDLVLNMLRERGTAFGELVLQDFSDPVLKEHVQSVSITDTPNQLKLLDLCSLPLIVHMFRLHGDGPSSEPLEEDSEDCASSHWTLPAVEFHGLWDSLVYDMDIKETLLSYAETTLFFSDKGVNPLIISWNRVVLLHGPPGTGKTSLCKALAQKLAIRLSHRYSYGQLVEINSHGLFSKWFSESGKLVQKMFQKLQEMIEDQSCLVCVLIDEVESLTSARQSALRGSEPSDAIRVVNALLTQLDQIRRYPNVLILTTSNVTGAIDIAFIDRADIKQYIGVPSVTAIYKIYHTCIKELMRVGIIDPTHQLLDLRTLEVMRFLENDTTRLSLQLRNIARQSEGLSGRTLRKLPFLAYSLVIPKVTGMGLGLFLEGLERAVQKQISDKMQLATTTST